MLDCEARALVPQIPQVALGATDGTSESTQANHVAHLQCDGCRTWLMYAYGARSVKCAICNTVSHTTPASDGAHDAPTSTAPAAEQQLPSAGDVPTVVVNPSTVDEDGNEVRDEAAQ
jgi:LSD1 subclass zinc finger protein